MPEPLTLYEFLERTGARVRAYDLGRRVGAIERSPFLAFEHATAPYPLPMQRKAWFALVQQPGTAADDPVIWFLRLGLDEQGLLVQAERDDLLERLHESARAQRQGDDPQALLRDNPYSFTPREDRMALFHALLSVHLGLPPSRFYAHALDYFRGIPGWDQWGFVGYQGIADVACRQGDDLLVPAIPRLPDQPLVALCHCLESRAPSHGLEAALMQRLHQALAAEADATVLAALIRGISADARRPGVRAVLAAVLAQPAGRHIEVLAAIAGRAWEALTDPALLQAYLDCLVDNDHGQAAFEHSIADLLSLPAIADRLRHALRAPGQSGRVREAFARMTVGRTPLAPD